MFPSLQFLVSHLPPTSDPHMYNMYVKNIDTAAHNICMFLLVVLLLWLVKCVKLTFIAWGITEDQTVRTLVVIIHSSNYIIYNTYIYILFVLFVYLFWLEHFGRKSASLFLSNFSFPLPKSKTRSSWICILNDCSDREDPGGSCKVCKVLLSASWTHGCHAEWCIVGPGGSLRSEYFFGGSCSFCKGPGEGYQCSLVSEGWRKVCRWFGKSVFLCMFSLESRILPSKSCTTAGVHLVCDQDV